MKRKSNIKKTGKMKKMNKNRNGGNGRRKMLEREMRWKKGRRKVYSVKWMKKIKKGMWLNKEIND